MFKILQNKTEIKKIAQNLLKTKASKSFVLYIPNKKLNFKTHPQHGEIYPVYIADEDFNKKNNPKRLMPYIVTFTSFNLFLFLTGLQLIPVTSLYSLVWINEAFILGLIGTNIYFVRQYFNYLLQYTRRVKNLYLLKSGDRVIIETFSDEVSKVHNIDIYERNIKFNFEIAKEKGKDSKDSKTSKIVKDKGENSVDNNASFRAVIKWGAARENHFIGKRIYLDPEIFRHITHRYNIETNETKFVEEMSLNVYSQEEKGKVLSFFKDRKIAKIPRFSLIEYYKLKYLNKK